MGRLGNAVKTAQTPLTKEEQFSIRYSARMGSYVAIHAVLFFVWAVASCALMVWTASNIVPSFAVLLERQLVIDEKKAQSFSYFIGFWAAPMLLIVLVLAAAVVFLCIALWRVRGWAMSKVRAWMDRPMRTREERKLDKAARKIKKDHERQTKGLNKNSDISKKDTLDSVEHTDIASHKALVARANKKKKRRR